MKLLDVLKKYDRCVMRESAKLTRIYKNILKESEEIDNLDEETCPDCGNDPCTCESDNEESTDEAEEIISADEFFGEAKKNANINDSKDSELDLDEDLAETEWISADEFFGEADADEAEEMISADEFFDEAEEDETKDESEESTDEAEEMMSAEQFFKEAEKDETKDECDMSETDENDESKEKNLEESLKSYRRANHRLFHD